MVDLELYTIAETFSRRQVCAVFLFCASLILESERRRRRGEGKNTGRVGRREKDLSGVAVARLSRSESTPFPFGQQKKND